MRYASLSSNLLCFQHRDVSESKRRPNHDRSYLPCPKLCDVYPCIGHSWPVQSLSLLECHDECKASLQPIMRKKLTNSEDHHYRRKRNRSREEDGAAGQDYRSKCYAEVFYSKSTNPPIGNLSLQRWHTCQHNLYDRTYTARMAIRREACWRWVIIPFC